MQITGGSSGSGRLAHGLFDRNFQSGLNLTDVAGFLIEDVIWSGHTQKRLGTAAAIYSVLSSITMNAITFFDNESDGIGIGTNTITCTACGSPVTTPVNLFSP